MAAARAWRTALAAAGSIPPSSAARSFIPTNPNTDVNSALFGRSTSQQNLCREMQYSLRLHF